MWGIPVLISRFHHIRRLAAPPGNGKVQRFGAGSPDRQEIRRLTPVRTVAIDGGPPESRPSPDNDGSTEKRPHGYCADFYWSQARSQVFRKNPGSRGDAEPHRGSEGVLRPVPADRRSRPGGRPDEGLQTVFKSVFPISDFSNTSMLEFVKYEFEPPKYDVDECRQRGMTYAAPLKVTLRLIVFDIDEETGAKSVKDIKEQDVYMGDIPLMTNNGTFIVNGTERVIVSQMHRSPGVFFDHDKGKTHSSGKLLFAARIIPYRGSWLDIEFDAKDIVLCAHRPAPQDSGDVAAARARHGRRGGAAHLLPPDRLQARQGRLARAVRCQPHARLQGGQRPGRRRHRQGGGRGRQEAHRAPGAPARREGPEGAARHRRGADRPLHRRGPGQSEDRRDLRRGRRGDHREEPQDAQRGGLQGAAAARHRPRQCRRLHPQHAQRRQEHDARGRAVRHLSRDASGRAADGRHRRGDVQLAVLRSASATTSPRSAA